MNGKLFNLKVSNEVLYRESFTPDVNFALENTTVVLLNFSSGSGIIVQDESLNQNHLIIPKKIIDVVTGSMVLFPASLTHYTIPFESEEERIVLAFDVVP